MSDRTANPTVLPTQANPTTLQVDGDLNVTGDYYQNGSPFSGGGGGPSFTDTTPELVSFSGTAGTLANVPDGKFFLMTRNGVVQNSIAGAQFTLDGQNITLVTEAGDTDVFLVWYSH